MKFGTLYAYWTREWIADYSKLMEKAKFAGFDVLEIGADNLVEISEYELKKLKDKSEELNLSISCNIGPDKKYDISSTDEKTKLRGIQYFEKIFEKMKLINSKILVGVVYSHWPYDFQDLNKDEMWKRAVKSTRKLCEIADTYDVDIAIEVVNRYESILLNTADEGVKFCKDVNHKRAKLLLDTFHMNIEEDDMVEAIKNSREYLAHFHIGESNRKLPGNGNQINWEQIFKALNDINYDGMVVMEPFMSDEGEVAKDIKVWRNMIEDKQDIDDCIKKSLEFVKNIAS